MTNDLGQDPFKPMDEGLNNNPAVSVVMPAYNTAPYIGEAVASVFRQTYRDFELIVVNDGSPDTADLETALEPYRHRIVYIRQENKGVSAARNTGIRTARAPLVAMLDSDDVWEPDYLAAQVKVLHQDPTIDLVYPNATYFGEGAEAGREFMELCPSEGEVTLESLVSQRCNVMSSVTAKRLVLLEAGLFDEVLRSAEDFDLWLRVVLRGGHIVYQRRPLIRYRRRSGSFMSDMIEHLKQLLRVVDKTRTHRSITPDQAEALARARTRCKASLQFYEGKQSFLRGDVTSAIDAWVEANRILGDRKLAWKLWCLRLFPGLVTTAYHARRRLRTYDEMMRARRLS